jgi:hypothetical protein
MSEPGAVFEPLDRWGLLPDRNGVPLDRRIVLRHWFVHFNPLYLLSAFCVLSGVFLVNRSLDRLPEAAFDWPRLALFAVMQAYEALVVVGAAFLARRARAVRPAVLLVLLEALFLFDGTLRLESLLLRSPLRFGVTLLWLALIPLKVWAMAAALQVRLPRACYARIAAAAAALAAVLHLLAHPATDKAVVLQIAAWLGAIVIGLLDLGDGLPAFPLATTRDERRRAERCARGAFRILTGVYFAHVWSYIWLESSFAIFWTAAVAQLGTLFLRAALKRPRSVHVWAAGALLVGVALQNPQTLPLSALVVATAWAYRAWSGAHTSLATGAAVAAYAALWIRSWPGWGRALPAPVVESWPTAVLAIVLVLIAWRLQDRFAGALVAAGAALGGTRAWQRFAPSGELARGITWLSTGFVLFVTGLAVNWWLRSDGAATPTPRGSPSARPARPA